MRRLVTSIVVAASAVSVAALLHAQAPAAPPAGPVTFAKDVQPILEKSCFSCHSADLKLGELDLSSRDAAMMSPSIRRIADTMSRRITIRRRRLALA